MPHFIPPTTLADDEPAEIITLQAGGRDLQPDERNALLARLHAGEPIRLQMAAVTFCQKKGKRNRRKIRFSDDALASFAQSFVGKPFLADHDHNDLSRRGGTILSSELVERRGGAAFKQVIELVKPWAVESALDGTLDRFSIAWHSADPVLCSVCNKPMTGGWRDKNPCPHYPGEEVEANGEKHIVEMLYTSAVGDETSAVNVPAVEGTSVTEIRTALAAARAEEERDMDNQLEALAALRGELETTRAALAAAEEGRAKAENELGLLVKEMHEREVEALVLSAKMGGKIQLKHDAEGKEIPGEAEKAIRQMSTGSLAAAREWVTALPRIIPCGPPQSATPDPVPPTLGSCELSAEDKVACKKLGISEADFLATKKLMQGKE